MEFWNDRENNEEVLLRVEGEEEYLAFNKRKEGRLTRLVPSCLLE
jgi:hypothetical protein